MTGDTKPGDAIADKTRDEFEKNRRERELAIERLKVRAELKSAHEEEPDTGVVHLTAEQRMAERESSLPERAAGGVRHVLDGVNSWQKVVALGILCAVLAFAAWLRWGR